VDEASILIHHTHHPAADAPVSLSRLSDVHFERATRWTSGIITIATDGDPLVVPTGTSVGGDPKTFVFRHPANDMAHGVYLWLQRVVAHNQTSRSQTAAPPPSTGDSDSE